MRWQLDVRSTATRAAVALMLLANGGGPCGAQQPGAAAAGRDDPLPESVRQEALAGPLTRSVTVPNEFLVYFPPGSPEKVADEAVRQKLLQFPNFEEDRSRRVLDAGMAVIRLRPPAAGQPPADTTRPFQSMARAMARGVSRGADRVPPGGVGRFPMMAMSVADEVREVAPVVADSFQIQAAVARGAPDLGLPTVVKAPPPPTPPAPEPPRIAAASGAIGATAAGIGSPGAPAIGAGRLDLVSDATALGDGTLWGLRSIRAVSAWKGRQPRTSLNPIPVAVLDTGINRTHPNLAPNLRIIAPPASSRLGIDDDNGHGSHVAGIIGAVGHAPGGPAPRQSVVGVEWDMALTPIKILDRKGLGEITDAVKAVAHAYAQAPAGPDGKKRLIINMSWAVGGAEPRGLKGIIDTYSDSVLFVAAAGNADLSRGEPVNDNDAIPIYPASFARGSDNVISVLAVDRCDQLAPYSYYGKESVDIGAPGGLGVPGSPGQPEPNIYSTWIKDPNTQHEYASLAGTSMAAAYVSGAAALLWADHPTWSPKEVKAALLQYRRPVAGLAGKCKSGGVLDLGFMAPSDAVLDVIPAALCTPATVARPTLPELDLGYVQPWAFVPPASASPYVRDLYKPSWPPSINGTFFVGPMACCGGSYPGEALLLDAGPVVAPAPGAPPSLSAPGATPTAGSMTPQPPISADRAFAGELPAGNDPAVRAEGHYDFAMYTTDGGVRLIPTSAPNPAALAPGGGSGGAVADPGDPRLADLREMRETVNGVAARLDRVEQLLTDLRKSLAGNSPGSRRIGLFAVRCTPSASGDPIRSRRLAAWSGARAVQNRLVSLVDPGQGYSVPLAPGQTLVVGICSVSPDGKDPRFGWLAIERTRDAAQPWKALATWSKPDGPVENSLQTDVLLHDLKVLLNADLPLAAGPSAPTLQEGVDPASQPGQLADDPLMAEVRVATSGDTVTFTIDVRAR